MEISKVLGLPDFVKANLLPLEVNFYGAAKLVADRLGIQDPPVSYVSWQHGWRPEDIVYASQLAHDAHVGVIGHPDAKVTIPAHKRRPYLVATRAYEALLRENGFPDTRAVGLPFSYVDPDPTVKRIPGSLLVMPAHVLMRMECGRANEIEYLEYIKSISHQFTRVVFCINLGCMASGLWIDNLNKYGFDYVFGAGMMDQKALFRMRRLFETFEYMTSNGLGSHFVYAGLCGVKLSVAGPLDKYPLDMHKNEPAWQIPEEREKLIFQAAMLQHDVLNKKFPWLYTEPRESRQHSEWAREELGYYNRVSFQELAYLFGWGTEYKPAGFLETAFRLDAADDLPGFIQFVQNTPHKASDMLSATTQMLARGRLRAAYILAMLLAKRGQDNAVTSLALSIGGLVYNNATEHAYGLSRLQPLVDQLSVEQQTTLERELLVPTLLPLLTEAIDTDTPQRLHTLLAIIQAAGPQYRERLEQEGESQREQARHILQTWQKQGG